MSDGAWDTTKGKWERDLETLRGAMSDTPTLRALIEGKIAEWQDNARRARANADNERIPAMDRRQCFGVSQAYEQCADELEALLSPAEGRDRRQRTEQDDDLSRSPSLDSASATGSPRKPQPEGSQR